MTIEISVWLTLLLVIAIGCIVIFGNAMSELIHTINLHSERAQQNQRIGNEVINCSNKLPLGMSAYPSHEQVRLAFNLQLSTKTTIKTITGSNQRRVIDSWDGVNANQIYYGPKDWKADVQEQLAKDVQLLTNQQVRTVIWHFFENARTHEYGPSPLLIQKLNDAGIGLIIHIAEEGERCQNAF